jgi:CelD/BcsL family acetyltransferase involved in cellulose biosynthesis
MAHPVESNALTITAASIESLGHEWGGLWRAIQGLPFTHPDWFRVWERSLALSPSRPSTLSNAHLAVRLGDQLIGVASLSLDARLARQSGDSSVTDYASPLALPGQEETVAAGILEWLVEDLTNGLDLWGVPEDSPMRAAFRVAAERFGWSYAEEHEAVCPRVALPADFESYVASLKKHERHEIRRKIRHLEASGATSFESVTGVDAIMSRFGRFLDLMRASRADKDEFLTERRVAFFEDLARTFGELGIARLGTLSLDGRVVAMVFCFEDETTTYLYNSGYDPEYGHLAVGLLSKVYAIRDSIARGKRVFDFLRGDEEYKRHLGGIPRNVLTLRLRG